MRRAGLGIGLGLAVLFFAMTFYAPYLPGAGVAGQVGVFFGVFGLLVVIGLFVATLAPRSVKLAIEGENLHLRMTGLDRIFALKSELTIPLAHIQAVSSRPQDAHGWFHGLRFGTNMPGVFTAGTFLTGDGLVFYCVHDPDKTIALDIAHETYRRVIVQVEESPEEAVARIEAAREPS